MFWPGLSLKELVIKPESINYLGVIWRVRFSVNSGTYFLIRCLSFVGTQRFEQLQLAFNGFAFLIGGGILQKTF